MNYKELHDELDRNIYSGNRYMLSKLTVRVEALINSKDKELQKFAKENIEILKKLKEPYDYQTAELIHHSDHIKINHITDDILAILKNK